jgi:hypothetical protein
LRIFCLRSTSVCLSRRGRAGRGKVIKRIQNTQTMLDLDKNHLWKLTHWSRDLRQGALNKRRPRQQPSEATPSWVHMFIDLRTLQRALNKRVQPQQQILHELGVLRVSREREGTKTRGLLPKAKEDVRLLKRQHKLQPIVQKRQINHPQELQKMQGSSATSSQDLDRQPSPSSTLMKATTTLSDINVQLLQVLREDVTFQNQGMIEEYCGMKESNRSQFTCDRMNYHIWKRKFIATISLGRVLV